MHLYIGNTKHLSLVKLINRHIPAPCILTQLNLPPSWTSLFQYFLWPSSLAVRLLVRAWSSSVWNVFCEAQWEIFLFKICWDNLISPFLWAQLLYIHQPPPSLRSSTLPSLLEYDCLQTCSLWVAHFKRKQTQGTHTLLHSLFLLHILVSQRTAVYLIG